jgi:hypothetical protein
MVTKLSPHSNSLGKPSADVCGTGPFILIVLAISPLSSHWHDINLEFLSANVVRHLESALACFSSVLRVTFSIE